MTAQSWAPDPTEAVEDRPTHAQRLVELLEIRPCNDCGEPIVIATTAHGKRLPFDASKLQTMTREFIIASDRTVEVTPVVLKHKCPEKPAPKRYRSYRALLADHPDLQALFDEKHTTVLGPRGTDVEAKVAAWREKWDAALAERNVIVDDGPSAPVGYGSDRDVPDPVTYGEPDRREPVGWQQ